MKACLGFGLAAAAIAAAAPAAAEPRAWTLLAQREVGDSADRYVVNVTDPSRYGEIRICVARQPVWLQQVEIRFRGGDSHSVLVNSVLDNGRCMGGISLPGLLREVSQVTVVYNAPGIGSRGFRMRLQGR